MNRISAVLLLILLALSSNQNAVGRAIPATAGISTPATSSSTGTNGSGIPSAAGNSKAIFYFNLTQLSGGTEFNQATLRLFLPRLPRSGSTVSVYKIRSARSLADRFRQTKLGQLTGRQSICSRCVPNAVR